MILLSDVDISLPLTNPVLIFSLVLFIILFAPLLLNKFKIPHIIGLIVAGVIIGPYGFNLLLRDSSIVLFGTVGLLYIMFIAGLEIDLAEFKKNRYKSVVFGLYTFILPMVLGTAAGYYLLGFDLVTSILVSAMFATHTLVAYPIASRYGVARNRSVTLTIGGTMITDILALLVLAAIQGIIKGDTGVAMWIRLGIGTASFAVIIFFVFPFIASWFLKKFDDNVSQYIFVLAMVFLGSFLAEVAGLEAIIGAFLAGLSLNRFIPHSSPLMNRIDFVGSAIFIPFFLISVGMLVDITVLFKSLGAVKVAAVMIGIGITTKYIAAWFTQKTFRLSAVERQMIFGLSNARAAATLAIVLVGYNIIIGETELGAPLRLLNEDVLNGTIIMILITCTVSSLTVEKASRKMALQDENEVVEEDENEMTRVLISIAYPQTVPHLIDFARMIKPDKPKTPLYALHVVEEENEPNANDVSGKKMMEQAVKHAAATDDVLIPITRFDRSITNGIIYTIKEHNISDVVIGLHHTVESGYHYLGPIVEKIVRRTSETIFVYKSVQPLNTLKRIVAVVPPKAEYEPGFFHWFDRLYTMSKDTGLALVFYGKDETLKKIELLNEQKKAKLNIAYKPFADWSEFLLFTRELKSDDFFVVVTSRKGYLSYQNEQEKVPYYLVKHFTKNSFVILYPRQLAYGDLESQHMDNTIMNPLSENFDMLNKAGDYVRKIFSASAAKKGNKDS